MSNEMTKGRHLLSEVQRLRTALNPERLAEALSWLYGDMTRYDETAHPDHNRWSWRGDGHGDALRDEYREMARTLREALGVDE